MTREQPDRESRCPDCGGQPTDQSVMNHKLSDLGYHHDDQVFECSDCGETYTHGVPVGEFDGDAEDLWCDVCDLGYMRVHRVRPNEDVNVMLDLKCHHHHEFTCPHCGQTIGPDGVQPTPAGARTCPFCDEFIPRSEVPYCHYFDQTRRDLGKRNIALVGFPAITGELNRDRPYGFPDDDVGGTAVLSSPEALLNRVWPGGCPDCTADDLHVDYDCGGSGVPRTATIRCDGCGAEVTVTDDPVEPGEATERTE